MLCRGGSAFINMPKVEILKKLDKSVFVHHLREFYDVDNMTLYDVKRQCERLLKFSFESEYDRGIINLKLVHEARPAVFDRLVYTCLRLQYVQTIACGQISKIHRYKNPHCLILRITDFVCFTCTSEYKAFWKPLASDLNIHR